MAPIETHLKREQLPFQCKLERPGSREIAPSRRIGTPEFQCLRARTTRPWLVSNNIPADSRRAQRGAAPTFIGLITGVFLFGFFTVNVRFFHISHLP
jgi:hypothetical protein